MFENLGNFLFKVSMMVFFVLSISLFLFCQREIVALIDLGESSYLKSTSLLLKEEIIDEDYNLGYEIIAQKIGFKDLPIMIDGVTIEMKNDLLNIDPDEKYFKNIVFNESGQVMYIEYRQE